MTPNMGTQQKTKAAKTKTVTLAALLSSPYRSKWLAWLSLDLMEALKLLVKVNKWEPLLLICNREQNFVKLTHSQLFRWDANYRRWSCQIVVTDTQICAPIVPYLMNTLNGHGTRGVSSGLDRVGSGSNENSKVHNAHHQSGNDEGHDDIEASEDPTIGGPFGRVVTIRAALK